MKIVESVVLVGDDAHQVEDQIELAIKRVNRKLSAKKQISYVRSEDSITIEAEPMQFFAMGEEFNALNQKSKVKEKTGKKPPKQIIIHFDKDGKIKGVCCDMEARVTVIDDRNLSKATSEADIYFSNFQFDALYFDSEDFEWTMKDKLSPSLDRVNKEAWTLRARSEDMRNILFFGDRPVLHKSGEWGIVLNYDSREEAIDYLEHRIRFNPKGTTEEKLRMIEEAKTGTFTYNGITCTITKLEENV